MNQLKFLRRKKQKDSKAPPRSVADPASGTAVVVDDQLNLPSVAGPWAEKYQVAGVASKSVPVRVPIPSTRRKSLSLLTMVEETRVKVKFPDPTIVQSGVIGVVGSNIQGCEKVTA